MKIIVWLKEMHFFFFFILYNTFELGQFRWWSETKALLVLTVLDSFLLTELIYWPFEKTINRKIPFDDFYVYFFFFLLPAAFNMYYFLLKNNWPKAIKESRQTPHWKKVIFSILFIVFVPLVVYLVARK